MYICISKIIGKLAWNKFEVNPPFQFENNRYVIISLPKNFTLQVYCTYSSYDTSHSKWHFITRPQTIRMTTNPNIPNVWSHLKNLPRIFIKYQLYKTKFSSWTKVSVWPILSGRQQLVMGRAQVALTDFGHCFSQLLFMLGGGAFHCSAASGNSLL